MVCEQADQVGGLFNSFWRQGYLFDGGIKAVENAGLILPTLGQLGLLDRLGFVKSPVAMITQTTLQLIRSPADLEAYFKYLMVLFPEQQSGLQQVLSDARRIFELLGALLRFPNLFARSPEDRVAPSASLRGNLGALSRAPQTLGLMNTPLRRYVQQRITHPGLANLLCDLFPDGPTAFFGLG